MVIDRYIHLILAALIALTQPALGAANLRMVLQECGISYDQYRRIASQHSVEFPPERWIEVCVQIRGIGLDPEGVLRNVPNLIIPRLNTVPRRLQELKQIGFINPIQLIKSYPSILIDDLAQKFRPKVVGLRKLGFRNPVKVIESQPQILSATLENSIAPRIESLRRLGFADPVGMIDSYPNEDFPGKIAALRNLGFVNPAKLIGDIPRILKYDVEQQIQPRIEALKSLGFLNPAHMIELNRMVLDIDSETLRAKIKALRQLGFDLPEKMFERAPALIGYRIAEALPAKIEALEELGFKNVMEMITLFPSILGYKIMETIAPKIEAMRRLGFENPVAMFEYNPSLLGLSTKGTLIPTVEHLRQTWQIPRDTLERKPRLIGSSLERLREYIQFFASLEVDVTQFSLPLRIRIIAQSASAADVDDRLIARGFETNAEKRGALTNRENWTWIFPDHKVCGEILDPDSIAVPREAI